MEESRRRILIVVDENLFIKDPTSSALGRRIIKESIILMDELGFEAFNFRRLAERAETTEAGIYRYFPNKLMLLHYLVAWYWIWIDYKINLATQNNSNHEDSLKIAIRIISQPITDDPVFAHVNESVLYRIVLTESTKIFRTKGIDQSYAKGLFEAYRRMCSKISEFILGVNPRYRFSMALSANILEVAHSQQYLADHLPDLTEITKHPQKDVTEFLTELVCNTIRPNQSR